ncbi:MAG TPA: hypothetical protein VKQ72_05210, partial [Aggregatilineales bacterium]|nr:hypothetical protein [Aggregatilineales bacterium]
MLASLPDKIQDFMDWPWTKIEPYYDELAAHPLSADTVTQWMLDWTRLSELLDETKWRLYVETTRHTDDQGIQERYSKFLKDVYPLTQPREQALKEKLLKSKLAPAGFEVPLRAMRAQADLYCEANVPLLAQEAQLVPVYDEIVGAQTTQWDGEEVPLTRLARVFQETDRSRRELAWRKRTQRQLADREAIMSLWSKLLAVRRQLAANAACADYREYRWRQM